ncbi:PSD1 and planctomycete cytochrome C domain-containing protein [Prosthecobacter sp.]|uniref:PSD1 and planctomycete cytochrome C domain-containing protein n=1 Tax=Prosthecobacter sp. TaxID=1965333 RepID=UPI0024881966|nr:PSD1 and planctomycete cytochrome C domain-containing protein [Prosthecobacter sp.]MDI1312129.1 PSD1 and planctomycete cytochrome C domain-containing protein [Prosthecobacter sp.]
MRRALLFLLASPALHAVESAQLKYNRDVRPILNEKCFHCHGTDASHRKGDLRLDLRDEVIKPAKSGDIALVPGKPELSQLIARVELPHGDDDVMPPDKDGKPLTAEEKAILRQWISEGAEYQGHWAFLKPERAPAPKITDPKFTIRGEIDSFIAERLQVEGLHTSPEADPATLLRRVTLDLTGLPPTPEEIAAFAKDSSPKAYEAVVDHLLKSEHYGEVMAMQWLDFARFADSHGFQTDSSRSMWPWRDWVIQSFNDNKPFDQFTLEQIGGDLLPNATPAQVIATGFNRNHRLNGEGGIIAEEWRIENIIDRVETTSFTWLGLTLNCCRCHDHKYDPFSQKDFYSFFAFFNNVAESGTIQGSSNRSGGNSDPVIEVPSAKEKQQLALLRKKIETAQAKVTNTQLQLPNLVADWEADMENPEAAKKPMWEILAVTQAKSQGGAALRKLEDSSWIAGGRNPNSDTYTVTAPLAAGSFTGVLLEALPDPTLPNQSLGRASNGNFVLTGIEGEISAPSLKQPVKITFARAEADYSQKGYDVKLLLDKDPKNGWAIDGNDPKKRVERNAMFIVDKAVAVPAGATLTLRLLQQTNFAGHNIGRFRLSTTNADPALASIDGTGGPPAAVLAVLKTPTENRTPPQRTELEKYYRASVDSPLRDADYALAAAKTELEKYERTVPSVMVMKEGPVRDAFVLTRGEYDKPGEKVSMLTPAVLPPMPKGAPSNRLGLAQWIVSPENPLTARVWVNRAWEKFFGYGLSKSTDNLGTQSEYPVHPELLDWLATEFIRCGWDMKAMQKLIVMSATYRQSSKLTPALLEKDPENRLLARGPRFRLSGEVVRDQALAVAGLLVPKIGGPSVKPYMPEGVWDETSKYGDLRGYKADAGEGLYRRSFYTIWKRTAAPPTMLLFDAPTREICTVKRSRTNTPLQALSLLNEVTFVEAARGLAQQMMQHGGTTPEQRIAYGFQRATARDIEPAALQQLTEGLKRRITEFTAKPADATALISQGTTKADASLNPAELAAYTTTASVLLNLDRVITRD